MDCINSLCFDPLKFNESKHQHITTINQHLITTFSIISDHNIYLLKNRSLGVRIGPNDRC